MAFRYEFKAQTIIDEGRTTREAINEIKKWITSTNIPEIPEEFIVLCLLSCENDIESTKNTIQAYFKIKSETPEMFTNRNIDDEEMKKAAKVVSYISIPRRINNTIIHFFKINDTNYQNFDWILSMKLAYMLLDISQRSNPPDDLIVVIDMKGVGFMHLTRLKIGAAKKFLEFLQEAMPLKIKIIHILNSNYIFDKLIALARVFIKNELMSIINSHPPEVDMKEFQKKWIPASCLPKEYDGELPSTAELSEDCIKKFQELKPYFEAEEKLIRLYKK